MCRSKNRSQITIPCVIMDIHRNVYGAMFTVFASESSAGNHVRRRLLAVLLDLSHSGFESRWSISSCARRGTPFGQCVPTIGREVVLAVQSDDKCEFVFAAA